MFKKILVIIVSLGFIITLSSCVKKYYLYEDMQGTVERIDIIEIKNSDGGSNITVIKTLDVEEHDKLLLDLSKIKFTKPFGDPPTPNGICIKLNYINSDYEIISYYGTKTYNKNGESTPSHSCTCSKEEFNNMISNFVDIT